jgi:mRNA-degrading endonuclease RelE of RelBE toxin-antitoxin system
VEIIETPTFTKQITSNLNDEEYFKIQKALIINPELGPKIPNTNGIRKLRWNYEGRGKRGGCRIIYYWIVRDDVLYMLFMYPKNVQDNLTDSQLKILIKLVERELT